MSFYGFDEAPEAVRLLYADLRKCWSIQTCAPRFRPDWSEADPTLGQCSISSFLVQDLFGGEVYGTPLPDGTYHCFNFALGHVFDLTSEQFRGSAVDYSVRVPQSREEHFSNADKLSRYELLKSRLEAVRKAPEGEYTLVTLRQRPDLMRPAAKWFHGKWHVPAQAYLDCMEDYLSGGTELGWYLCLFGESIVGGLGVIENDFHDRKDLAPNVCAVYTEPEHRCRGVAGRLLCMAVEDLRSHGISPVYLVTDHTGFYERYGWEFYCLAQGDGEPEPTRLYVHR